jgi:hypothetical protein
VKFVGVAVSHGVRKDWVGLDKVVYGPLIGEEEELFMGLYQRVIITLFPNK